ncbi:hypothetical protein [Lysinibacillus piscis]|uniref:DegT/DnrJ/EryC1/StrS aminotransferase family protein n=1 Tax=Lysinibacillus piscis TaxID=2518931 RepID=A0ABQ5NHN9_9BACI|nr:hypothetical protein [Lysinibacillus sp. KH24]GLC87815.1 hypothetical protein LYSBPC_09420 [Lysinibacillus sp. KH24]
MEEIGGYFGFEQLINNEYYKEMVRLNTARNALLHILKSKKYNKIFIPYYLCNSVSDVLVRDGYNFEYYYIDSNFTPIFDRKLNDGELLYIVNYFGQLTNEDIFFYKRKFRQIAIDNTHAFFQHPVDDVDTIYSCRKFFGVPDGAYLFTNIQLQEELGVDESRGRMEHLLGRYEGKAYNYYNLFSETEETFSQEPLKRMSTLTQNILGAIDYKHVQEIRNKNYSFLNEKLGKENKLKLTMPNTAFMYPFYIENGDELRKKLVSRHIYIPTLWPNILEAMSKNSLEYQYAINILPLPCDQRYAIANMQSMLEEIERCKG